MEYRGVVGSATKLKKNSIYKATIADATKEHLYRINTTITNAHEAGLAIAEYKLPLNFRQINNVSNKEVQTEIYFKIVTELERLDYDVQLKFGKECTMLIISWIIKANDSELSEMRQKLLSLQ